MGMCHPRGGGDPSLLTYHVHQSAQRQLVPRRRQLARLHDHRGVGQAGVTPAMVDVEVRVDHPVDAAGIDVDALQPHRDLLPLEILQPELVRR